jgi:aminoglycoside 6-adenylyltransferase
VEILGEPTLAFLEPTAVGRRVERRVLYAGGQDVDFAIFSVADVPRLLADPAAAAVIRRGYRSLYDDVGFGAMAAAIPDPLPPAPPTQHELTELASDVWYHALWTAKKLRRGEVFTAVECLNGYMKARLVSLMAMHARAVDPDVDTWHAGRFLERWGDPGALVALETAYARYSVRDVARALWESIDLFQGLEEETARRLGLAVELDHADLRRRISEVVPDPRRRSTL